MIDKPYLKLLRAKPGSRIRVSDYETGWAQTKEFRKYGKENVKKRAGAILEESLVKLAKAQELLYADDRYSVLIILQALDAAGKDGTIRHVMSGVNPQGCQVFSFKKPSAEDIDHTFLWRCMKCLPERGRIGIFNRSYYEEVLVVRVHQALLDGQRLPTTHYNSKFWQQRFDDINAFEQHLVRNGTIVVKFFLNVSKGEQKKRFMERLDDPKKHWKFSAADMAERKFWPRYMDAYSEMFTATSTKWAPWYIIPADYKWIARATVADILTTTIHSLDLRYPKLTKEGRRALKAAKRELERE